MGNDSRQTYLTKFYNLGASHKDLGKKLFPFSKMAPPPS